MQGPSFWYANLLISRSLRFEFATVVKLTQLCLPHMEEKKFGRIVFNSRCVLPVSSNEQAKTFTPP